MVCSLLALHHDVVDVDLHGYFNFLFEHRVYQSLVSGSHVLEVERYDLVVVNASLDRECGFLLVGLVHGYLVVVGVCIQETEQLVPRS
ncbi:hypothetical protein ACFX1Z_045139 [Malus domestica]